MLDGVHIPDDIFITAALDVPQAVMDDSGEFLVRLGDDLPLGLDVEVAPAAGGADHKGEGGGALEDVHEYSHVFHFRFFRIRH